MSRIAIFGAGYVGLVTGACFAELGHDVVVRDVVPEQIDALAPRRGAVPRAGARRAARAQRASGSASRSTSREALDGAEFLFVCVDTPPTLLRRRRSLAVWTVARRAAGRTRARRRDEVDRAVGTGEKVRAALDARGLDDVGYVSNPEFPAEGTAVRDFLHPDRIVIGAFDEADGDAVEALHAGIDAPVVRTDVNSAEMIKLAANAFLMTRISFINEIANVCELVGADVAEVAEGVGLDHRLGPHFLRAGIGYGGSLLPEGLARAEAARRELGLPLPAADGGDRGERAAEAARDPEAAEAPRHAARQDASRCSGSPSSRTRTTCARRRRSCSRRVCSPRAPRCAAGIRSRSPASCCRA